MFIDELDREKFQNLQNFKEFFFVKIEIQNFSLLFNFTIAELFNQKINLN